MSTTRSRSNLRDTLRASRSRKDTSEPRAVAEVMTEGAPGRLDRRLTVYMNSETWRQMRHRALEEGTNISQTIEVLCQDYLDRG